MVTTGFSGNFAAGVVSAIVVLAGQQLLRKTRDWITFSPVAGDYEEFAIRDGEPWPTGGTIRITHVGRGILSTEAWTVAVSLLWRGTIRMNAQVPNVGDGAYFYVGRRDCGTHHVQLNRSAKEFVVLGVNTSDPQGSKGFNMVWRRR